MGPRSVLVDRSVSIGPTPSRIFTRADVIERLALASSIRLSPEEETVRVKDESGGRAMLIALWDGGSLHEALPGSPTCVVGRGSTADVVVDHTSVSRRHVAIHTGSQLFVEDLDSAGGTRVRGQRIPAGERIAIGWREPFEIGRVVMLVRPPIAQVEEPMPLPPADGRAMQDAEQLARLVAPTDISVLLLGESGVGKGHLARKIHEKSNRASGPWIHLDCAILSGPQLESELFGHERGAFAGGGQGKPGVLETAQGGTIFLDEISGLPVALQGKLLVALERRETTRIGGLGPKSFDVRFISATGREIEAAQQLRPDLNFRLSGLPIHIPPLRERRNEIADLVWELVPEICQRLDRAEPTIGDDAMKALSDHDWPGNIRELATVVERALRRCGSSVEPEHLTIGRRAASLGIPPPPSTDPRDGASPTGLPRTLVEEVVELTRPRIGTSLE